MQAILRCRDCGYETILYTGLAIISSTICRNPNQPGIHNWELAVGSAKKGEPPNG